MIKRLRLTLVFLFAVMPTPGQAAPGNGPSVGKAVPALALPDIAGRTHRLSDLKQPVTLLFFCGCAPCHEFAHLWSQVQQNGDLAPQPTAHSLTHHKPANHNPATVVVFLGGAADARVFAAQTGLDLSQTLILTDLSDQVGQKFGVIQCPRVFVVNAAHRLVYTNPDDPEPALSAPAVVSRTLTAWRRLPIQTRSLKKATP